MFNTEKSILLLGLAGQSPVFHALYHSVGLF